MLLASVVFSSAALLSPSVKPLLHPRRCGSGTAMRSLPDGNDALFAAVRGDDGGGGSMQLLRTALAENDRMKQELMATHARIKELEDINSRTEGLCEVLDDGGGWTSSLRTRASWLLGLLVCQSCSSFVLADNEALLVAHPTVIYFMTMLVGAGGNAGNQAAVRIIRGLATGEVVADSSERTVSIVSDELIRAFALALVLVLAGFVRVIAFQASVEDALAISTSLFLIVSTSVVLGTLLPLALSAFRIDAAHASTTIQVIMDVLGVVITCTVATSMFSLLEQSGGISGLLPSFGFA